uniref:Uncharacterized protein n=1 Tax=Meloidogyne enterolobii TaxID=390850 RepID=A0A6V7WBG1_MELEN|nr:unnamed protein product [Meloidogyne enterolobii]
MKTKFGDRGYLSRTNDPHKIFFNEQCSLFCCPFEDFINILRKKVKGHDNIWKLSEDNENEDQVFEPLWNSNYTKLYIEYKHEKYQRKFNIVYSKENNSVDIYNFDKKKESYNYIRRITRKGIDEYINPSTIKNDNEKIILFDKDPFGSINYSDLLNLIKNEFFDKKGIKVLDERIFFFKLIYLLSSDKKFVKDLKNWPKEIVNIEKNMEKRKLENWLNFEEIIKNIEN